MSLLVREPRDSLAPGILVKSTAIFRERAGSFRQRGDRGEICSFALSSGVRNVDSAFNASFAITRASTRQPTTVAPM